MSFVKEVQFANRSLDAFNDIVGKEVIDGFRANIAKVKGQIGQSKIWNINSTESGGGVAEMLRGILGYGHDLGSDLRWLVISGDLEFFKITKRIHNSIHGSPGDGGSLGSGEAKHYKKVLESNRAEIAKLVTRGDFVVLHDPQTAGLVEGIKALGAHVIWRSHIGHEDRKNEYVKRAWDFLRPYLNAADAFVLSRRDYVPDWMKGDKVHIIQPSIDPFTPKNQPMKQSTVESILYHLGLISWTKYSGEPRVFTRQDGSKGEVKRHADVLGAGPLPQVGEPMVVQVSRWDRLKDMTGVMNGFADYVINGSDCHLVLVGPSVHGVADDPEGAEVLDECIDRWRGLPHFKRRRIRLVCLPMKDLEENAAMVNAIQRHATVIVQKSLCEGFGLTVTEAMWKNKPVVASAVGDIQSQIDHGKSGMLVQDPTDLKEFGKAVAQLLNDPKMCEEMGRNAVKSVKESFLTLRHLRQYAQLISSLNGTPLENLKPIR